jgi:putative membrane protein
MRRSHLLLLLGVLLVLAWSAWKPYDRLTWWLETFPTTIGLIILAATYRRFQFTTLCYTCIALHMCLLCVGGHYTYAREPVFSSLRHLFHWQRNDFDRLGHFAQGFVPALIAREIFIRLDVFKRTRWMPFVIVCVCLAISASYELFEWQTAVSSGSASTEFLATQGDPWDTQKDMFMALLGAVTSLAVMSRWHNRQLAALTS